jgi:hypothetical protein
VGREVGRTRDRWDERKAGREIGRTRDRWDER